MLLRFGPFVFFGEFPFVCWSAGNTADADYDRDWRPRFPLVAWDHPQHPKPIDDIHQDWATMTSPHEVLRKYVHPENVGYVDRLSHGEANYVVWLLTDDFDDWDIRTNTFAKRAYHASKLQETVRNPRRDHEENIGDSFAALNLVFVTRDNECAEHVIEGLQSQPNHFS